MTKIEAEQRRILRAIFLKFDSLASVFADNKILTVSEHFMVEMLEDLFGQLKCDSPRTLLQTNGNPNPIYQTKLKERVYRCI